MSEQPLRWSRLYALVAGLLAVDILLFYLLSAWAR
jgi:hypothetical protein